MKIIRLFAVVLLLLVSSLSVAQFSTNGKLQLGIQYYQQSDFGKAIEVFEGILKAEPLNIMAYTYLFDAYLQVEDLTKAEKLSLSMAKKDPSQALYEVDHGLVLRRQGKETRTQSIFDGMVKKLVANRAQIVMLANAFRTRSVHDYAIKVYLRGRQLLQEPHAFSLEMAEVFSVSGQKAEMILAYLDLLAASPQQLLYVQNMLQSRLTEDDYEIMRGMLLQAVQKRPDDIMLSELLVWYFVQQKDFRTAFEQAKALDLRRQEGGSRVIGLARSAMENRDYEGAIDMYAYLFGKYQGQLIYYDARYEWLEARRRLLENSLSATADWQQLSDDFQHYLTEYPGHRNVLMVQKGLANILAYQLKQFEAAAELLEQSLERGGDRRVLAALKLDLGDIYMLTAELWEAALMYGQVEKDYPNEPLGQEAKFRNARLSFYKGEFEWAQAQLDVLKASTTQRISNDAMALSLLISDNLDLDTTIIPMRLFAEAELRMFRQEYDLAQQAFDSLLHDYPGHALSDEVWYRQAAMHKRQGNYPMAIEKYKLILKEFGQDILADDALFEWATLYDKQLNDSEQAMKLYQELLIKFPDSTYTFEARRRFRQLRGDKIN
jgi:tetratricopeptide (TPR) repeat protein